MGVPMMADAVSGAGGCTVAPVMAATVAATAASIVAAMSVGEDAGAAGIWVQLAVRMRSIAVKVAKNFRISR